MPALTELDGQLLRCKIERTEEKDDQGRWVWRDSDGQIGMWSAVGGKNERTVFEHVERVADAHGVRFLCPKSFSKNGGPKGTHSVYIFFTGSPYAGHNSDGKEVRWQVVGGTTLNDLQLSPSILEQDEELSSERRCGWHGFVGSSGVPPGHAA